MISVHDYMQDHTSTHDTGTGLVPVELPVGYAPDRPWPTLYGEDHAANLRALAHASKLDLTERDLFALEMAAAEIERLRCAKRM